MRNFREYKSPTGMIAGFMAGYFHRVRAVYLLAMFLLDIQDFRKTFVSVHIDRFTLRVNGLFFTFGRTFGLLGPSLWRHKDSARLQYIPLALVERRPSIQKFSCSEAFLFSLCKKVFHCFIWAFLVLGRPLFDPPKTHSKTVIALWTPPTRNSLLHISIREMNSETELSQFFPLVAGQEFTEPLSFRVAWSTSRSISEVSKGSELRRGRFFPLESTATRRSCVSSMTSFAYLYPQQCKRATGAVTHRKITDPWPTIYF